MEKECNCCNGCNAYGYPKLWKKDAPCDNQNEIVKSNIVNGCWICNNQYYNLNNRALFERSMFNGVNIPPCNTVCQVDVNSSLRIGQKS